MTTATRLIALESMLLLVSAAGVGCAASRPGAESPTSEVENDAALETSPGSGDAGTKGKMPVATDVNPGGSDGSTRATDGSPGRALDASTRQGDAFVEPGCAPGVVCGTLDPVAIAGPDSGILEVMLESGNGQHFFCYPQPGGNITANGLLFIHVVATRSNPATDHEMELEACSLGFAGIGPMYEDYDEVTGTCDPLGTESDACYTEVHEAVVYGHSYALPNGMTPASYTPADSLVNRTATLLRYLATAHADVPAWQTFSNDFAASDASHVVLAGHSQGSGHSLYWSHRLAPTREIMLSGPPDRVHTANGGTKTPTWIQSFASDAGIAPGQLYGFNNVADSVVDIGWAMSNDDALGMASSTCNFNETLPSDCHRVVIDAGCSSAGENAHGTTEVSEFGRAPGCITNTPGQDNLPTWQYLLGR
jgi:hypothetical protein